MPKGKKKDDNNKVIVPPAADDGDGDDAKGRSLNDLSDDEISALQVVVDHYLPEGKSVDDALKHVGRFGLGDDAEWRFVPPDDWTPAPAAPEGSEDDAEGSDADSGNSEAASTDTGTSGNPGVATSKADLRPRKVVPIPRRKAGPQSKTWDEMTDDEESRAFDRLVNKGTAQSVLA